MFDWSEFIAALVIFIVAHVVPMHPLLKVRCVAFLGRAAYIVMFSMLSLGLLYWLLIAAGRAPYVEIWSQAPWQRWIANLAMPIGIVFGVFAIGAENPFSFGGNGINFKSDSPGIIGLTRHPLMWAFALWAAVHLLVNGDLAHIVLFAPLLVFALSGIWSGEMRARRELPDFDRIAAHSSVFPGAALVSGRWRPKESPSILRLLIAVLIWNMILYLHAPVIGVSPLP